MSDLEPSAFRDQNMDRYVWINRLKDLMKDLDQVLCFKREDVTAAFEHLQQTGQKLTDLKLCQLSEDIFLKNCMLNLSKFPVVSFYSMTYPLEPYLCQSKT